jgi:glycosyltransferase involved in cell wall biosynthesis
MNESRVCLNMIVRDEAHVIARALVSAKPHIDYYVIVDTGSTDRTKDVIQEVLKNVPGKILDRPWVDFGHNRTEALALARGKCHYILTLDADDELVGAKPLKLIHDEYHLIIRGQGGNTWTRPMLFRSDLPYRYEEPIHEYLVCDTPIPLNKKVILRGLEVQCYPGQSARARDGLPAKYLRDAELLEKILKEDPNHANTSRRLYYLGQSYRDAGVKDKAIETLEKRVSFGGEPQETFSALMYLAEYVRERIGYDPDEDGLKEVERAFMRAHEFRPSRLEPILDLCDYWNVCKRFEQTCTLAKTFLNTPMTTDSMLVDRSVWEWRLKDCYATAAFFVGNLHECKRVCSEIARHVPREELPRVLGNIRHCELELGVRQGNTDGGAGS